MQPLFFDEDLSSASNFDDHEQSIDLNGKGAKFLTLVTIRLFQEEFLIFLGDDRACEIRECACKLPMRKVYSLFPLSSACQLYRG